MANDPLHLPLVGPFTCHASSGRGLFEQTEATKPGVYIWTIRSEKGFRVYYLGQTGRSCARRMEEHLLEYLSGRYRLWDEDAMRRGEKTLVWQGMWKTSVRDELDQ